MKKNRFMLASLALATSLVVTACGDGEGSLRMVTGGTSGTYYPLGGGMAKTIQDNTDLKIDVSSSNASVENMLALSEGKADIAFVQTDVMANGLAGGEGFEGEITNVLALGSLYPEMIQIVTTADSGIESVEDLKGKKVSIGAPGSGARANAEEILEIHGMTVEDIDAQNLDFGESTGGIQDGNIDAAFITAGTPTAAVENLSATTDVSVVPIAADKAQALIEKYPYYAAETIPSGTYNLTEDVETVAVLAMIAVKKDLPEDDVYEITKAIYENKVAHAKGTEITLETALDGVTNLHPGAKKYFEEQGLSVE
ncbi:TAXI family TRAP transporter solute-binding subunit [Shouchella lonarensis]|uniref:TRAP transporter solute receptor, TAXI family n=1 Tax=Shouchella lonarensis TaxID=1464122 RepID=A0A1G6KR82_9BACI|nr:TAXI family TRAP transporter solute-binding subunit [Shouchella lonarensis]SDC33025.1 hypothetical protein SAMN05421737_107109 [Shouchella lonarensis]